MAVVTFVDTLEKVEMTWGMRRLDAESRSIFGVQALEAGYPLWECTITSPQAPEYLSGGWKALLMKLRGRVNQMAIWDMGRPVPVGTMRGSMILASAATQGDVTMSISTDSVQGNKTLVQGDMLGIGSGVTQQVVMVVTNATANGSGTISVTFEPPLRNSFATNSVVTWNKPMALFRRDDSAISWKYTSWMAEGFALNLVEDWRA